MSELPGQAIALVLAAYGLRSIGEARRIPGGTLNLNYRVETARGALFVRCHRSQLLADRVREEHALVRWSLEHGVPVVLPLSTLDGDSIVEHEGAVWAVYPWLEGRPVTRGSATRAQAAALGEVHGLIHAEFANHPASAGATFDLRWDKDWALGQLEAVLAVAREASAADWICDAIALQRRLLEAADIRPPSEFSWMPCQLAHGDFHDQQVLFQEFGEVEAVTDWEMFGTRPRAWEVIRSLSFGQLLQSPLLERYLGAYRRHVRLSEEECIAAVQLWWQSRLDSAWLWSTRYIEGNERVEELFPAAVAGLREIGEAGWREGTTERFIAAAVWR